ncbi:hypothetical protein C7S20_12265 [Christiangramia fulva]|uniref:YaiO beta-barrel domain-containing protein n=1 Tax=Christiangramia fulva TaxID=2126553 RepID=A0A2R3Z6S4_9FLAO|nr:YaiO family outer membrane beta-barrel protein [Christiangramia fulva]AVR45965.1 hypothetical protein C7S20_12265 [Christiangramia fulva]
MAAHRYVILLLFFLGSLNLYSQEISETNTDSIYFKALNLYKNKEYPLSLDYTNKGLELAKDYHDIRILRIRNEWVLQKIDQAEDDILYLMKYAKDYPGVKELAEKQIGFYSDASESLSFINEIEMNYEVGDEIRTLQASLLLKVKQPEKARKIALELFKKPDLNKNLRYQLQNILTRTVSDEIGLSYQYVNFSKGYSRTNPWNTIIGEYLHYFNRTALIGRIHYTDRSFDNGYLYELESYPVFSDKFYAQLTAGFSNGDVYPEFRGSASIFLNFLKVFEAEAGGRLLHFSNQDYFTGIIGLTAYQGKFYLNLRSFIGPERLNKIVQNYQFNLRYYFKDIDNYLFARIGSGISPDEKTIFTQVQENPGLEAYYFNIGLNKSLGIHHLFQLSGGYLNEDIDQNNKGNQFLASLSYRFRF